jgi:hypothetical protein
MYGSKNLHWRSNATGGFALYVGSSKTPALHVLPDASWPGMHRIALRGGHRSDMTNLSRAIDAANAIALTAVNAGQRRETPPAAPPMRFEEKSDLPEGEAAPFEKPASPDGGFRQRRAIDGRPTRAAYRGRA